MLKNEIVQLKSYDEKTGTEIGNVLPITNSEAVKVENDKNLKQKLTEITNKINQTNSSLDKKAKESDLIIERNRINLLTKVQNGETEGNTELLDIRNGADGIVYDTAGEAIREQINNNKLTNLVDISSNVLNPAQCTENASVGWNSDFNGYDIMKTSPDTGYCISPIYNVKQGQEFIFNHKGYQTNIYFAKDNGKISSQLTLEANKSFAIPEGVSYMRYRFTII